MTIEELKSRLEQIVDPNVGLTLKETKSIKHIGYDEEKLTLVVEYPLSILAVYSYITNIELSNFLFDDEGKFLYVEEGTIIAEYVDRFKVIFLKDNKYMSYQNVINQN